MVKHMQSCDESNEKLLEELINKRKEIENEMKSIDKEIFKYETVFLENSHGFPLTKNLEYYLSNKNVQKKVVIKDSDRIFSKNIPKINEN